jgi:hypothetical protein
VIGEIVAGLYGDSQDLGGMEEKLKNDPNNESLKQQIAQIRNTVTELAKLTGAGGALLIGGDAGTMQIAMGTAQNAAVNNFLNHAESSERLKLKKEQLACTDDTCRQVKQVEIDRLNKLDAWRDDQIEQACKSPASAACQGWTSAIQSAAASYQGQYGNLLDTAERSSVLNQAFKYQQAVNNPFLHGVGQGLLKLTPPGLAVGAMVGAAAAVQSVVENGAIQTVVDAAKGLVELPENLRARLNSSDPSVVGEALVDVFALSIGATLTAAGGTRLVLNQVERVKLNTVLAQAEARTRVENNANADASFGGGVPVRPRDGQVPSGTAQIDTPIAKHLIDAQVNTNRQGLPSSINGGHNMDNFNQTLQANGGQVVGSPKEVAPGIYQVEYRLPGTAQNKVETKTIYDPAKYTDVQMASMANEAVGRAIYQWNAGGGTSRKEFVTVNGIKFEVPIGSYRGQVYVPTAYPSGN